jgi:hypothetical protein
VLRYFDPKEPVTIQYDSSNFGLVATLLQGAQPVFMLCGSLLRQRKTTHKLKRNIWRFFSLANDFTNTCGWRNIEVESDHKPLEDIFRKPICDVPKRLQRMLLSLQKYNVNVSYKKGKLMYIANLSEDQHIPRNRGSQSSFQ